MRISSLIPAYRKGQWYHNKTVSGTLEVQQASFPKSKKWDLMDAQGYTTEVIELSQRLFVSNMDPDLTDKEMREEERALNRAMNKIDNFNPNPDFRII